MTEKHINEYEPRVRQLAHERLTDREIAVRLGLKLTAVQDLRARFGIPPGSAPLRLTIADRAAMVRAARGPRSAKGGA